MTDEVLFETAGAVARIRLNRPKAIHALTHGMCSAMIAHLLTWRADPAIALVTIDHAPSPDGDAKPSRGFCAGGDIRAIAESGAGDGAAARAFFAEEYRLNHLLFTSAKPIVSFMDGITMGGGVGIAQPAALRVATERTVYAMPETGIGLFPDVGGGWYLSRLPGRVGRWLALTGARLNGAECLALGLATHYVSSDALDRVKAALAEDSHDAAAILDAHSAPPPDAPILARRAEIDRLFASDDYEAVLAALEADGGDWAAAQRAVLAAKSPLSCTVALREQAESLRFADFADEMRMEYRLAARICQRHDFVEGVRAVIVDKDSAPRWDPATAAAVSGHVVDTIFSALPADEEWTPVRF